MDLSIFVAQILALAYLSIGLGLLFNRKYYVKAFPEMMKNHSVFYLGGVMALIIGYLLVTYHNFWVKDWTVIITILGWGALIKGITLLAFPEQMMKFSKHMVTKKNIGVITTFVLTLGLIFGYFGFIA